MYIYSHFYCSIGKCTHSILDKLDEEGLGFSSFANGIEESENLAKPDSNEPWSPSEDDDERWIEAAFTEPLQVTGITMTGSNDKDVTFTVQYSLDDGDTWEDVEAANGENVIISSF